MLSLWTRLPAEQQFNIAKSWSQGRLALRSAGPSAMSNLQDLVVIANEYQQNQHRCEKVYIIDSLLSSKEAAGSTKLISKDIELEHF